VEDASDQRDERAASRSADLLTLTKAKLSALVVLTTGAGFVSGVPRGEACDVLLLLHTVFGTTLAAFGAAVFNQLLEVESDRKMRRTVDRPLPSGRMPPIAAFGLGWLLCAFGIVHLAVKVNALASLFAGLTIAIYLFVYTPLKRRSRFNTLVGAVSGALPPVIGWVGAGGGLELGALWWFALLFFWQMPHFYAINWLHREEYQRAGFVMLANRDESGTRTSRATLLHALVLVGLAVWAPLIPVVRWWGAIGLLAAGVYFAALAWGFVRQRQSTQAKKLFLGSLLYLPVVLILALVAKP